MSLENYTKVNNIKSISPGNYISCDYTISSENTVGTFSNLGSGETLNFICVGYDHVGRYYLLADRNVQTLTNTALSEYDVSTGKLITIDDTKVYIKLLSRNSWEKIQNSNIIEFSNEIWNYNEPFWTYEIPDTSTNGDQRYILSGENITQISEVGVAHGFKPAMVIEFDDSTSGRVGASTPIYTFDMDIPVEIGMSIPCEYTAKSGQIGVFSKFGLATKDWILAEGEEEPDGSFNFIFVGYSPEGYPKLVADRNIQTNISFQTLHNAGFTLTTGTQVKIDSSTYYMRLPGSSTSRFVTAIDYGEWDAIISLMTNKYIETPSDPNIWNCGNNKSWTMDYISYIDETTLGTDDNCIIRGLQDTRFDINDEQYTKQGYQLASYAGKPVGFRPVLLIVPPDTKYRVLYSSDISFGMFSPFI